MLVLDLTGVHVEAAIDWLLRGLSPVLPEWLVFEHGIGSAELRIDNFS